MGASVVSCSDASPVFELSEHVLDFMPLLIKCPVIIEGAFAAFDRRNTGHYPGLMESFSEPVAIVAPICEQRFCFWQGRQNDARSFMVAHLSFRQEQDFRIAVFVANRVKFRVQAAFGPSDTSG